MKMPEYVLKIKAEMEKMLGCGIEIVEDREISYPCKMEYARNYARDRHVVRINPDTCANAYPAFSMLLLAKLQLQALPGGGFGILQPVSDDDEVARFAADFRADRVGAARAAEFGPGQFDGFVNMIRTGLLTQTCSQVLEMLACDAVMRDYPDAAEDMRAYLRKSAVVGAALGVEEMRKVYPAFVVRINRSLNLLFAMRCGEFCGERLVDAYAPNAAEVDEALDLYGLYRAERDAMAANGRIAGDVIRKMMAHFGVDRYAHLQVIEIAPADGAHEAADDGLDDAQRRELADFYEHHGDGKDDAALMTLGMFKILRELRNVPLSVVRDMAVEIAMLGASGISPTRKYRLKCLPNRGEIWGQEILAYYYVSWAKAFPEKVDMLGLPYKAAYVDARKMLDELRQ